MVGYAALPHPTPIAPVSFATARGRRLGEISHLTSFRALFSLELFGTQNSPSPTCVGAAYAAMGRGAPPLLAAETPARSRTPSRLTSLYNWNAVSYATARSRRLGGNSHRTSPNSLFGDRLLAPRIPFAVQCGSDTRRDGAQLVSSVAAAAGGTSGSRTRNAPSHAVVGWWIYASLTHPLAGKPVSCATTRGRRLGR